MPIYKFGSKEERGTQVYYELICDGDTIAYVIRHTVEWLEDGSSVKRHLRKMLPAPQDIPLSSVSENIIHILNDLEGLADLRDFHDGTRFNVDINSDIRYTIIDEPGSFPLLLWEEYNAGSTYFYPADSGHRVTTGEWIGPQPAQPPFPRTKDHS